MTEQEALNTKVGDGVAIRSIVLSGVEDPTPPTSGLIFFEITRPYVENSRELSVKDDSGTYWNKPIDLLILL